MVTSDPIASAHPCLGRPRFGALRVDMVSTRWFLYIRSEVRTYWTCISLFGLGGLDSDAADGALCAGTSLWLAESADTRPGGTTVGPKFALGPYGTDAFAMPVRWDAVMLAAGGPLGIDAKAAEGAKGGDDDGVRRVGAPGSAGTVGAIGGGLSAKASLYLLKTSSDSNWDQYSSSMPSILSVGEREREATGRGSVECEFSRRGRSVRSRTRLLALGT